MNKRQMKKIESTYLLDEEEDLLLPPSAWKQEDREMEKYFSKAWRISNPEKAKEMDAAIEEAKKKACAALDETKDAE